MKWDIVVEKWLARLLADASLISLLDGKKIFVASANRPVKVPSVEWFMLYDHEEEWLNPVGFQVDIFARGMRNAAQIERRIRLLTHRDTSQDFDNERMWFLYRDARSIEFPSDPGVVHRALDFECQSVRGKYVQPGA